MKLKSAILAFLAITCTAFNANADAGFGSWLTEFKAEARQKGISERTLSALDGIEPIEKVIELDRKQPEGTMTFARYKDRVINNDRISEGRALYKTHRSLLSEIGNRFGVPPQFIVALWGIETSYGKNTGGFSILPALATLAYEGRRAAFFKKELLGALRIIDEGHISGANMKGSWAGAMGQNQFMPSSFHAFAVDGNNDGRRDIWNSLPDVFSSTANYLHKSGWNPQERWGRAVRLPKSFPENLSDLEISKSLGEWRRLGITDQNGDPLPSSDDITASVVTPDGLSGPAYLVYDNYRVIMKWNKSKYFATSVGLLADQIAQ
jgi:membrane-bound lytic murein transglycosylase B